MTSCATPTNRRRRRKRRTPSARATSGSPTCARCSRVRRKEGASMRRGRVLLGGGGDVVNRRLHLGVGERRVAALGRHHACLALKAVKRVVVQRVDAFAQTR